MKDEIQMPQEPSSIQNQAPISELITNLDDSQTVTDRNLDEAPQ